MSSISHYVLCSFENSFTYFIPQIIIKSIMYNCFQILFRSCMRVKFTIPLGKRGNVKMFRYDWRDGGKPL
jgi:hypothetical protein